MKATAQAVAKNTISMVFMTLTGKVIRVAGFFLIAAVLPATELGRFSLALACVEVVGGLADFGVDTVVIRRLALFSRGQRGQLLSTTLGAKLLLAGAAYGLAVAAAFGLGFGRSEVLLTGLAALPLFVRAATSAWLLPFQADLEMSKIVLVSLQGALAYLGLIVTALWFVPSPGFLILMVLVSDLCLLALTFWLIRRKMKIAWPQDWQAAGRLIADAAPLGIATVFVMAYFRLDTLILRKFAGLAAVGFYSVAYRITESVLHVAGAYGSSMYPIFSAQQADRAELARLFRLNYSAIVTLGSLLAMSVSMVAQPLAAHLAPRYLPSAAAVAVLIWATVFMLANTITWVTINSLGWHYLYVRFSAVNLVVNLVLNLFLIPRWGVLGACIATIATETVNFLQQAKTLRGITGLRIHLVWLLPTVAAASVCLSSFNVGWPMLPIVLVVPFAALALRLLQHVRQLVPAAKAMGSLNDDTR